MQRINPGLRLHPPSWLAKWLQTRQRSFTLRQHLLLLVLITSLPLIALATFVSLDRFYAEREANRTSLMVNARILAAAVEGELDTYLAIIHTLSKSPTLLGGHLERFWQEAKDASALVPGAWVIVAEHTGQQLLNTQRPFGDPLPGRGAMPWIERAFSIGQPQVSDIYRGVVAERPVASVEVPLMRNGAPLYSLAISFDTERFHQLLIAQKYPAGWLLGILDRQGRFVARIPEHAQRVGTPASEGWRAAIARAPEGWHEHLSLEGERVHTAYASTPYGWIVGLSVPQPLLHAPARRSAMLLLIFGSTLLALSLALAWFASSRIARPADVFSVAAAEMSQGKVPKIEKTGVKEFDGVVRQFDAAAALIRERTDHQRLLLNELSHRVKNILAVVQSLVLRTLADHRSMPEARDVLTERLHALARVHELLMRTDWKGASIKDIISAELAPFAGRVEVDGPELTIDGKKVQTLALVLHELATNAAKHGALSDDTGKVSITWRVTDAGKDGRFKFRWQERDGPVVKRPSRKGFGSTLLEAAITSDLNVKPRLAFKPSGFVYELDAPISSVAQT